MLKSCQTENDSTWFQANFVENKAGSFCLLHNRYQSHIQPSEKTVFLCSNCPFFAIFWHFHQFGSGIGFAPHFFPTFIPQCGELTATSCAQSEVNSRSNTIRSTPVCSTLPGCFSMLKSLKCSKSFHRQQILLPGVAWAVRIEQTHKASFYCRVEVVVEGSFPMFHTEQR